MALVQAPLRALDIISPLDRTGGLLRAASIAVSLQELAYQFLAPSVQLPFEVALAHLLSFARTEKGFGLSEGGLGRRMGRLVGGNGLWGTVRIAQLSRHRRCAFPTSGQTPTVLSVSPARWRRRSKRPRPRVAPNATQKARPDNLVVVTTAISEASPFPRHATKTLRECPGAAPVGRTEAPRHR